MKKTALLFAALLLAGAGCARPVVTSFEECVAAGNPVNESSPRQCRDGEAVFFEDLAPPTPEPETTRLMLGADPVWFRGLVLALKSVEDSRCPKDVQCVWAGELAAVLDVSIDTPASEHLELRLGQTTRPEAQVFWADIRLVAIDETSATVSVKQP